MGDIKDLIIKVWSIYEEFKNKDDLGKKYVVGRMPILFFGNFKRYMEESKHKVITVGLNPSCEEFKLERFPISKDVNFGNIQNKWSMYQESLNEYFKHYYEKWFNSLDVLLKEMDCSFFDGKESTVLHTDFCSPLATNPKWSNPKKKMETEDDAIKRVEFEKLKPKLEKNGNELWIELVSYLKPELIIISISKKYLQTLEKKRFLKSSDLNEWDDVFTVPDTKEGLSRKSPYIVKSTKSTYGNTIIFGKAANTPFGTLSTGNREELGKVINEKFLKKDNP